MVDIVISEKLGGLVVAAVVTGGAIMLRKDSCGMEGWFRVRPLGKGRGALMLGA